MTVDSKHVRCETRKDIVQSFIDVRGFTSLLEIGARAVDSLGSVDVQHMVSVNKDFSLDGAIHETSRDYFFVDGAASRHDIIYIDGCHLSENVAHDIRESVRHLNPGGVVVIHDCLPDDEKYGSRTYNFGRWFGDAWRAVIEYFSVSPYLCYTVDTDCGCGIVDTKFHRDMRHRIETINRMDLDWSDFANNRDRLLRVINKTSFRDAINGVIV